MRMIDRIGNKNRMKCDELQVRLDDYLDGNLDTILVSMLENHIASCGSCNENVKHGKELQSQFKRLADQAIGNTTPSEDFISSAFEKVRATYPEQASTRANNISVKTGFFTALAAGFSLWAVLTTFILPGMDSNDVLTNLVKNDPITKSITDTAISVIELNINETKMMRLAIDTPDAFDNVTLSVELPSHVELKGHKNKRELSWTTKLAKGNNILKIPLKAIEYGEGNFIARLTHNGKVKTFKLFLKSSKPGISRVFKSELQV